MAFGIPKMSHSFEVIFTSGLKSILNQRWPAFTCMEFREKEGAGGKGCREDEVPENLTRALCNLVKLLLPLPVSVPLSSIVFAEDVTCHSSNLLGRTSCPLSFSKHLLILIPCMYGIYIFCTYSKNVYILSPDPVPGSGKLGRQAACLLEASIPMEGDRNKHDDLRSAWLIGLPWVCPVGEGDSSVLSSWLEIVVCLKEQLIQPTLQMRKIKTRNH